MESERKYIQIDYDLSDETSLNPSLVVFPSNHPNLQTLNSETAWAHCQNRDKKRKEDKLLLGESKRIIFESKTKMQKNMSDYVVGIFSKKKRELKFVDIDSIFSMNYKIRRVEDHVSRVEELKRQAVLSSPVGNENNDTNNTSKQSKYIDNKLQLIKDFGTTKAKKAAAGIKAHMVNENNISSVDAVKKVLEDNAVKQSMSVQMNEEQQQINKLATWRTILPEFDLEAKDKKEIFALESCKVVILFLVIDSNSVENLNNESILSMYKDNNIYEANKHKFTPFSLEVLKKINKKKGGVAAVPVKIKFVLYLDYLIKFFSLPKIIKFSPENIAKGSEIDLYFVNKFLVDFAENSFHLGDREKFVKTPLLVLKNIYHILILALMLNDYQFDYSTLAESMKTEEKEIFHYFKEIGCKLSDLPKKGKNSKRLMVELVAPLKLNTEHPKYSK
jgi:hypothetical protein